MLTNSKFTPQSRNKYFEQNYSRNLGNSFLFVDLEKDTSFGACVRFYAFVHYSEKEKKQPLGMGLYSEEMMISKYVMLEKQKLLKLDGAA